MLSADPPALAILGLVSVIGIAFCLFGYALAEELLAWLGWIAGGLVGAFAWWFQSSRTTATMALESQAVELLLVVVVGAVAGRVLLPFFTRFTVVIAGFVSTGGSAFVFLTGGQFAGTLANSLRARPTAAAAELATRPELQTQQMQNYVVAAIVAGLLGAILALKFYELIVTGAATALGAGLIAAVVPLWRQTLSGDITLEAGLGGISPVWFGVALVVGLGFQLYYYGEELNVPYFEDDEPKPLE
ncbi:hypothetical protein [Halorussus marinus]|uniref:hypothetical protein n=1 Tax=Halorussus marinus TaxID=2505976 RepID=UPI00106DDA15|nr:hypothetical protein [Halorussus marinus]